MTPPIKTSDDVTAPAQATRSGHRPQPAEVLVSIVMATFNRSNIIGHAIRSVLRQSETRWELLIIGDACTDDTQAVVDAFGDPRIRFINRARNFGEQSGPNNDGVAIAHAPFLAFLNHDDVWLPQHLTSALDALCAGDSELCFSVGLCAARKLDSLTLIGATTAQGDYHPGLVVPASLWVMRRELASAVGPWRPAGELRLAPSQDWLHRAWLQGARLKALPTVTALLLPSGGETNSYRNRSQSRFDGLEAALQDPLLIQTALLTQLLRWEDRRLRSAGGALLLEAGYAFASWILRRLRVFPPRPLFWLRNARKGALIGRLRRTRGLPPLPADRETRS